MAKEETWYDNQANAAKLITYAALLVLLGSVGWAAYSAWQAWQVWSRSSTSSAPAILVTTPPDYHVAMFTAVGGIAAAAFLYGVAVIIDLLIVGCEALRNRR